MTDQLDEIFAAVRAETLREIRAPGPAAAQLTVRRRRRTKIAAAAVAVLAAAGLSTLVIHREPAAQTPAVASEVENLLAQSSRPVVKGQSPVVAGYQRRIQVYVATLTVEVACVGTGKITLAVNGTAPDNPTPTSTQTQVADNPPPISKQVGQVSAACAEDPSPAFTSIHVEYGVTSALTIRLAAFTGKGAFAYQLIGPTYAAFAPDNPAADPALALQHGGQSPRAAGADFYPSSAQFTKVAAWSEMPGKSYTLSAACTGSGTATVQIRRQGRVIASNAAPCSWPATRHDIDAGSLGKDVSVWIRYSSPPFVPASPGATPSSNTFQDSLVGAIAWTLAEN